MHAHAATIGGKDVCFVPLIACNDHCHIGTALFFPAGDILPDGELLPILQSISGDLTALIVSKRKATVNSQLADIAGMSPNEIYMIDPKSLEIIRANKSAQINTGYRPDQIMRMTPIDLKDGISEEQYRELLQPLVSGKTGCVSFEARQRRRDGTLYHVTVKVWMLQHAEGTIFVELIVDESDNKKLLGLLQATFDSFPGGIAVYNESMRLIIANSRLYELMDLPQQLFPTGTLFEDILRFNAIRGEYGDGDREEIVRERLDHFRLFLPHAFERERADGTILEIRGVPLASGGCVVTYMDVTVRRRAEIELIHHRNLLEDAVHQRTTELMLQTAKLEAALDSEKHINEQQRQFVTMASHEFRTPLTIIDGAAQRLMRKRGDVTPDFIQEKTEQIRSSVDRMVQLMESILAAERLKSGKLEFCTGECDLRDIVLQCVRRQAEYSPKHQISTDVDGLPEAFCGDALALMQVFTNLLSNAVKYSPQAPDIFVKGWIEDGMAVIEIKDCGLGIDRDDLPRMFQLYFRARTSSGIAGTGIGLNLVKQIVELHDGDISIDSMKGEGTAFTVKLPLVGLKSRADEDAHGINAAVAA